MTADLWVIARKELLESVRAGLRERSNFFGPAILIPVLLLLSFQLQQFWIVVGVSFVLTGLMALTIVMATVADSYAGERERHTLETLMATRVSDRSVFWGKLLAMLGTAACVGIVVDVVALLIPCIAFGRMDLYPLLLLLGFAAVVGSLVFAAVLGALGLWVSARSLTIKQAAQRMSIVFLPFMLLPMGTGFLFAAPQFRAVDPGRLLLAALWIGIGLAVLVPVGAVLIFWFALRATRRERLMLS